MAGEKRTTNAGMMAGLMQTIRSEKLKHRPSAKLIAELEHAAYSTNPKRSLAEIAARQFLAEKPRAHVLPTAALAFAQFQADWLDKKDRSDRKEAWAKDAPRLEAGKIQFGRWLSPVSEDLLDETNTLATLGIHNRYFENLSEHLWQVLEAYRALKIPWMPPMSRRSLSSPLEDLFEFCRRERSILETASIRAGGRMPSGYVAHEEQPPLPEEP